MRIEPSLTYRGALALLGQYDRPVLDAIETVVSSSLVAGGAAGIAWCLNAVDPKSDATKVVRRLLNVAQGRLLQTSGQERLNIVTAAHTTLVAAAFFDALQVTLGPSYKALELTKEEKAAILTNDQADRHRPLLERLWRTEIPMPGPVLGYVENRDGRLREYFNESARRCVDFLSGLAAWDRIVVDLRINIPRATRELVERSLRNYDSSYKRLAAEVAEFRMWAMFDEFAATRQEIVNSREAIAAQSDRAMSRLEDILNRMLHRLPDGGPVREMLARANRAVLGKPILDVGTERLRALSRVPNIEEVYVEPRFRYALMDEGAAPASEQWWLGKPLGTNIESFIANYLRSPESSRLPLVILGQPGAGKSLLTRIIAARLPAAEYIAIQVPLRRVTAHAMVRQQIQQAVEDRLNGRATWADLMAENSPGTYRVVLLDGLDELMQASRTAQSRYLFEVAEFQDSEADLGCATAAIVTSRTVMADHAQIPRGALIVRLEDFDDDQVHRWLSAWNGTHPEDDSFRPLGAETAFNAGALGRQPLLLTMLGLYTADPAAPELPPDLENSAALYERLVDSFLAREVGKDQLAEGGRDLDVARVKRQKARILAVAAFGMFNRGLQFLTEEDFQRDLDVMRLSEDATRRDLHTVPLTSAQLSLGQFFFVLQSGDRDQVLRSRHGLPVTYEFLHATFGEFLASAEIVRQLMWIADRAEADDDSEFLRAREDARLRVLLSHRLLVGSVRMLTFMAEQCEGQRDRLARVVIQLIASARNGWQDDLLNSYNPNNRDGIDRLSFYTNNLFAILGYLTTPISLNAIALRGKDPVDAWRRLVRIWRATFDEADWAMILRMFHVSWKAHELFVGLKANQRDASIGLREIHEARLVGDAASEAWLTTGTLFWGENRPASADEISTANGLLRQFFFGDAAKGTVEVFGYFLTQLVRGQTRPSAFVRFLLAKLVDAAAPVSLADSLRRALRLHIGELSNGLGWRRPEPVQSSPSDAPSAGTVALHLFNQMNWLRPLSRFPGDLAPHNVLAVNSHSRGSSYLISESGLYGVSHDALLEPNEPSETVRYDSPAASQWNSLVSSLVSHLTRWRGSNSVLGISDEPVRSWEFLSDPAPPMIVRPRRVSRPRHSTTTDRAIERHWDLATMDQVLQDIKNASRRQGGRPDAEPPIWTARLDGRKKGRAGAEGKRGGRKGRKARG